GFCAARMLCTENETPSTASRPFDLNRSLGVLAEGSCIMVLETLDHALDRGATPYAEVIGYGSASDPSSESATGLEQSMITALGNASLSPSDITYISAHAPSDLEIDRTETRMIKNVFGDLAYNIPISSIKGSTGNPLAAGGAMQTAATALSIRNKLIPPVANYSVKDPDCDLDYVQTSPRASEVNCSLINSHGIGKVNSCLVLKGVDAP
ncbi:MAG TPA: beta-ACP synthase, partial [Pontiella sp.]